MNEPLKAYFSNRIEQLFTELKSQIFTSNTDAFTKRYIIVPSPAMKNWLMAAFAKDPEIGISAGVTIATLEPSINDIASSLAIETDFPKKISEMELALKLEVEIQRVLKGYPEMDASEKMIWSPLACFIQKDLNNKIRETRRILALSVKLANLFNTYGKYGSRMLKAWKKLPKTEVQWQERLWIKCVNEIFPEHIRWNHSNATVHVFGLSFISRQDHKFFMDLSKCIPLHYYLLSPCQAFWSEILSDNQCQKLLNYWEKEGASEAQKLALEEYIFDRNPLLANLGRVGREMALQIENSEIVIKDAYTLPGKIAEFECFQELIPKEIELIKSNHQNSLLHALQADLLLMRNPAASLEKINFDDDHSIQCLVASTLMREVQVVYDNLLGLMQRHAKDKEKIYPEDIIVMAPDIMKYEPFIKSVFSQNKNQLSFQLMDLNLISESNLIQGFNHLLNLGFSRFDVSSILQLFENSSFQKKFKLSLDDVAKIRKWIQSADVRWGEDPAHRREIINRELDRDCTIDSNPSGTWELAIERLLLGMAMIVPETTDAASQIPTLPLNEIDMTQASLFGRWARVVRSLSADLKVISEGRKLTLEDWSLFLRALLDCYFEISNQDENDKESYQQLTELIKSIKGVFSKHETFSFLTIKYHLDRALNKQRASYKEGHLHAVRFCSMLPMRALPAKIVVLMGMNEESYPRTDSQESLNLLKSHPERDYCPTQSEFDRYLFLETIMSARRYFILTYSGYSKNDAKEQHSSLLVTELLDYLDHGYTINQNKPSVSILKRYPFNPYDKRLFEKGSEFHSYGEMYFRAAKILYANHAKIPEHAFIKSYACHSRDPAKDILSIDLKMLKKIAKNPIDAYLKSTLGMYLREDGEDHENEESFLLDPLGNYILKKSALTMPLEKVLSLAEKEGMLPLGPFKNISIEKLKLEDYEIKNALLKLGISCLDIKKLTCSDQFLAPAKINGEWKTPPIECSYNGKKVKIVGSIPEITAAGMLSLDDCKKPKILQLWPEFLVFLCLVKQYSLPLDEKLIFLSGATEKTPFFKDPFSHLEKYVAYYFQALENISPLLPEWVPDIMASDGQKFEGVIQTHLSEKNEYFHNHSLKWTVRGSKLPDHRIIVAHWKNTADELFGDLFQHWFPQKQKDKGKDDE